MSSNLDRYERIAPLYDLLDLPFEYSRYRKLRPLLFQGLKGRVLDAGIGTGRNIQFYPPGAQVVGIDGATARNIFMPPRGSARLHLTTQVVRLLVTNTLRSGTKHD